MTKSATLDFELDLAGMTPEAVSEITEWMRQIGAVNTRVDEKPGRRTLIAAFADEEKYAWAVKFLPSTSTRPKGTGHSILNLR